MSRPEVVIATPVLLTGGTEVQSLHLVRALAGGGYRVTVCCYFEYDLVMADAFRAAGAEVELLGLKRSIGLAATAKAIHRFLRSRAPRVVHVQYLSPGFIPVLAAKLAGSPVLLATVHQPGWPYGSRERLLLRSAARLCDSFLCNSLAVEKSWFGGARLYRPGMTRERRHFTVYNGVDCDRIAVAASAAAGEEVKRELGLEGRKVVGTVGRLAPKKGQLVLMEAMESVVREMPGTALLVVGEGTHYDTLHRRMMLLGLEKSVVFTGRKAPEEVYRLLAAMDVAVFPSRFEGFGLAAAEAMAAGVPVVASRVDGLIELVGDGGAAAQVAAGDSDALARAIERFLFDSAEAKIVGEKGRVRVREAFSHGKFAGTMLDLYAEILTSRKSRLQSRAGMREYL